MNRIPAEAERGQQDKETERSRYNVAADACLANTGGIAPLGAAGVNIELRSPYLTYERLLRAKLCPGMDVLELGTGSGMHTGIPVASGAQIFATDISERSLTVVKNRFKGQSENLKLIVSDIETMPFPSNVFDVVCAAGVLSYGDNGLVMEEIYRVLKPGGTFICVDSLNNNPVYRLNRWLHYIRGKRSKSTLRRMPSLKTLCAYRDRFNGIDVLFFGGLSFLAPVLVAVFGGDKARVFLDRFDTVFRIKKLAFKFVMVAKKDG